MVCESATGAICSSRATTVSTAASSSSAGHHAVHDADALGLGCVDHLGEERQLLGLVHADEARQEPRAAVVDAQAPLHEDGAEAGGVGRDHEVAPEREVEPGAGGDAVDLGDGRLAEDRASAAALRPDAAHVLEPAAGAARHLLRDEIGAGAERPCPRR